MKTQIRFEKIVPSGQAMAHFEGRAWFCLGALPGELCEVTPLRQSKTFVIAKLEKIIESSKYRNGASIGPAYAPWQPVSYDYQLELKNSIMAGIFGRPGSQIAVSKLVASPIFEQYRNKLTFALIRTGESYSLGMHQRGSKETILTPNGCELGYPSLNEAAIAVLYRLNKSEIGDNAIELSVRCNTTTGGIVAMLAITKRYKIDFQSLRAPGLEGLIIMHEGKVAWTFGEAELLESILGTNIRYPAYEFMQVNIPAFELALSEIFTQIDENNNVLDLYGGAGAIGLPLARSTAAKVLSVEVNAKSVELSKITAENLGLMNFKATSANADELPDSLFMNIDTLIVDPPRDGLSRELIDQVIKLRIERIIYLSCDPATQARDAALFSEVYNTSSVIGFDFYPSTPNLESLMTFDLKTKL